MEGLVDCWARAGQREAHQVFLVVDWRWQSSPGREERTNPPPCLVPSITVFYNLVTGTVGIQSFLF